MSRIIRTHQGWMHLALAAAEAAGFAGEVPVGAVLVDPHDRILALTANRRERDHDPTAHAEILALRNAGQARKDWQLKGCRLYVTLEPCPMCTGAIVQARLKQVIYGVDDPKAGAMGSALNLLTGAAIFHRPEVIAGICEQECRTVLLEWFKRIRKEEPQN